MPPEKAALHALLTTPGTVITIWHIFIYIYIDIVLNEDPA